MQKRFYTFSYQRHDFFSYLWLLGFIKKKLLTNCNFNQIHIKFDITRKCILDYKKNICRSIKWCFKFPHIVYKDFWCLKKKRVPRVCVCACVCMHACMHACVFVFQKRQFLSTAWQQHQSHGFESQGTHELIKYTFNAILSLFGLKCQMHRPKCKFKCN